MLKYQFYRLWADLMSRLYVAMIAANSAIESALSRANAAAERSVASAEGKAHDSAASVATEHGAAQTAKHVRSIRDAEAAFGRAKARAARDIQRAEDGFSTLRDELVTKIDEARAFAQRALNKHRLL